MTESFAPEAIETFLPSSAKAPVQNVVLELQRAAKQLGAARLGIAEASDDSQASERFAAWIERGYFGEMNYLKSPRVGPEQLLPGAKSVLVLAFSYGAELVRRPARSVAAYAEGPDYHHVLKLRLRALGQQCAELLGTRVRARLCVDTAPLLERRWAERAGIGFTGKSTLTVAPGLGTAFVLGELIIDQALPASRPVRDGCGECTACLNVCPTGAFVDAYTLDARRCIAYLTIEHKGSIAYDLRAGIGERVFGCDECQRVCPYNASRKLPKRSLDLEPESFDEPDLVGLLTLSSSAYRKWVQGTARRRTSRAQLQRNAAIAIGNRGREADVPVLCTTLNRSAYPVVRAHVAWALGQIGGLAALDALSARISSEPDQTVQSEITRALRRFASLNANQGLATEPTAS
ncbi:MAG TPA: tRNA epoxyqueuosine(34) reductase QueG [Polyangiaceae bacterium]|nr:tRNA epoxyqueuosine(34) reductase QueG [Polyangiaceae bacterium]